MYTYLCSLRQKVYVGLTGSPAIRRQLAFPAAPLIHICSIYIYMYILYIYLFMYIYTCVCIFIYLPKPLRRPVSLATPPAVVCASPQPHAPRAPKKHKKVNMVKD